MKKKTNVLLWLGLAALVFVIGAFLFPIGSGVVSSFSVVGGDAYKEAFAGYDFVFGNQAARIYSTGAFIAAFSTLIIGAVFTLAGFILTIPDNSHKFSGFLNVVGGVCILVTAVIFILSPSLAAPYWVRASAKNVTLSLGWGFIAASIAAFAAGALSVVGGLIPFFKKK